MSRCGICGHPDSRHRWVDAIEERVATGEELSEVLADYKWDRDDFVRVKAEVDAALGVSDE